MLSSALLISSLSLVSAGGYGSYGYGADRYAGGGYGSTYVSGGGIRLAEPSYGGDSYAARGTLYRSPTVDTYRSIARSPLSYAGADSYSARSSYADSLRYGRNPHIVFHEYEFLQLRLSTITQPRTH